MSCGKAGPSLLVHPCVPNPGAEPHPKHSFRTNNDSEPSALDMIPQWRKERGILGVNIIPKNHTVKKGSLNTTGFWQVMPLASKTQRTWAGLRSSPGGSPWDKGTAEPLSEEGLSSRP